MTLELKTAEMKWNQSNNSCFKLAAQAAAQTDNRPHFSYQCDLSRVYTEFWEEEMVKDITVQCRLGLHIPL